MLVREIMTVPAHSLPEGSSMEVAIQLLARAHVSALPVVDPDHRVVGIVSEADIRGCTWLPTLARTCARWPLRTTRGRRPWTRS
jgi:CBS-domain-containing membrane protein